MKNKWLSALLVFALKSTNSFEQDLDFFQYSVLFRPGLCVDVIVS